MRRSGYFGVALFGLLVVAAISVAAGSGRKPAREQGATVSLRRLSGSEVMDILHKFPEMVPSFLASSRNDPNELARIFEFVEVTAAPLARVLPAARFYKGLDFSLPPSPYLMAVVGNKRYWMPGHFNQLLLDNGLQVTDKNIIELAKTFVLLAAGSEPVYGNPEFGGPGGDELAGFPQVTFIEGRRIEEYDRQSASAMDVEVICRVDNGEVQTWKLSQSRRFPRKSTPVRLGQFERALVFVDGKPVRLYRLVQAPEETRTGALGTGTRIEIVDTAGNATAEFDSLYFHYYLESYRDGAPTNYWVRLRLYEFDPFEANVYVRVKPQEPYTFGPDTLMGPVAIDSAGEGFIDWAPDAGTQTGMTDVCAGSMPPGDTFSRRTRSREQLTIEQVFTGQFQGGGGFLAVHFCDQFFAYHDSLEGHAPVFAQRVKNAMLESWQTQVNTWSLGTPPDTDNIHQVFVNDAINWYHALPRAAAYPGPNRRISVPFNIWGTLIAHYTNEDSVIRSTIAHEFYHGIQWGLDSAKWARPWWRWFTEGQARFIQSVQCPVEEFKDSLGLRLYATSADSLLTTYMNTSLETLSIRHSGYPYCLFWRCMFERFDSTGIADGVRFVRDCYAANVGTNNSIGRGKAAIDSAIAKYVAAGMVLPGWENFCQVLDQFAIACYLNDSSFNKWNPNPPGIYSPPDLTLDTAFRLGPDETDSYIKDDSIPHSFGIDLMQVTLDRAAASGMLRRTLDRQGLEVIIGGNQGSHDGCNDCKEDRSIQGGAHA